MPEISRFFGIVIRMFVEAGAGHHRPHFHAYHQNETAVIAVDSVEIMVSDLGRTQERFVLAWAEMHQAELIENWKRLQTGTPPVPISPLR